MSCECRLKLINTQGIIRRYETRWILSMGLICPFILINFLRRKKWVFRDFIFKEILDF
jgi:hypothetical protein